MDEKKMASWLMCNTFIKQVYTYLAVLYLLKYIKDNLLMCKSNAKAGDDAQSLNKNFPVWGWFYLF